MDRLHLCVIALTLVVAPVGVAAAIYLNECRPRERADLLVINDDLAHPLVAGPTVDARGTSSLN